MVKLPHGIFGCQLECVAAAPPSQQHQDLGATQKKRKTWCDKHREKQKMSAPSMFFTLSTFGDKIHTDFTMVSKRLSPLFRR